MPVAKVKCQIYESLSVRSQWAYRVIRGSRVVLVPGELYSSRGACRRAVRNLVAIATSPGIFISPLEAACFVELDREQAAWNKRPKQVK